MPTPNDLEEQLKRQLRAQIADLEADLSRKREKLAALEGVRLESLEREGKRIHFQITNYMKLKGRATRLEIVREMIQRGVGANKTSLRNDPKSKIEKSITKLLNSGKLIQDGDHLKLAK